WVARQASLALGRHETAETDQTHVVAGFQRVGHAFGEDVERLLGLIAGDARAVGDGGDEFSFRHYNFLQPFMGAAAALERRLGLSPTPRLKASFSLSSKGKRRGIPLNWGFLHD